MLHALQSVSSYYRRTAKGKAHIAARNRVLDTFRHSSLVDWGVGSLVWCNVDSPKLPVARPFHFRGRFLPLIASEKATVKMSFTKIHGGKACGCSLKVNETMVGEFTRILSKLTALAHAQKSSSVTKPAM